MKKNENKYQLSKTLRFGLTLKEKISNNEKRPYQSHSQFRDLIILSENKIREGISTPQNRDLPSFIHRIQNCTDFINDFIHDWWMILMHTGQIELDKDYYKSLTKKVGFVGFWYKENKKKGEKTKQPQARNIPMGELRHLCPKNTKECATYITDYWKDLLITAANKLHESSEQQKKFIKAMEQNRTDNKPNEIDLKKSFLSLVSVTMELLNPILNGQILFNKMDRLDMSKKSDNDFIDFVNDHETVRELNNDIEEIIADFKENGNNVNYCKATLNQDTALKQHNNNIPNDIATDLEELMMDSIVGNYDDVNSFMDNCVSNLSAKEKIRIIKDSNISLIYRAILFKYKMIPANVRRDIAQGMAKKLNKDEENIYSFLCEFGTLRTPQKDYADLKDKDSFNLNDYPLKVAFDFAWEGLAKAWYHDQSDFPIDPCRDFLQENFDVNLEEDQEDEYFLLYADLIELNALLSTLDKGNPADPDSIKNEALEMVEYINWNSLDKKNGNYYKKIIKNRLKSSKGNETYERIKKEISMSRGRLKNKIEKYDDLTSQYKRIAMDLGKKFASLRDKIIDANEDNKVTHYAMILEDSNCDKYLLLQKVSNNEDDIYHCMSLNSSDPKAYYVDSVTSSAIAKMIRKETTQSKKTTQSKIKEYAKLEEKERRYVEDWCSFISKKKYDRRYQLNINNGLSFEALKKEIDSKSYILVKKNISVDSIRELVENEGCLLFPIVNKDLTKERKTTEDNQFTKDWNMIFSGSETNWRLTPEFRVTYRNPVPGYPNDKFGSKRYSRFQMNAHFVCDFIPSSNSYTSNREQIAIFKDENEQKKRVEEFNRTLSNINQKFYVIGIDRGQKELATLCVVDQDKKIHGDFKIYSRKFNSERKQWEHYSLEGEKGTRNILDLSNLRVETSIMIDGKPERRQVLVDLSEVKVKDKEGNYTKPNKMQIKMQQMAYVRKLQFQMQANPTEVLEWYEQNPTEELIIKNLVDKENGEKGLISFYGAALVELDQTLPVSKIKEMLEEFKILKQRESKKENVQKELNNLTQLEAVDSLKAGIVANMVGVISYILKTLDYNAYISLEDLSTAQSSTEFASGISGAITKMSREEGRRIDVEKYAGLGLYNFFEMQLLRKLHHIQTDSGNILHLVPAFRAQKNYDHIMVGKEKIKNQFGIVFFVDAAATSIKCPRCGAVNKEDFHPDKQKYPDAEKGPKLRNGKEQSGKKVWVTRDKEDDDRIKCYCCGFDTKEKNEGNPFMYIKSGDDNAAYLISDLGIESYRKAYELAATVVEDRKKH